MNPSAAVDLHTTSNLNPTPTFDPWTLGASLYVPATRPDLLALGTDKLSQLTSLIYCTEDAVREEDVALALENLQHTLPQLPHSGGPLRFIRARNPRVLTQLLQMDLSKISGFVLPKIHAENAADYMHLLANSQWQHLGVMFTLETHEALCEQRMMQLRDLIVQESWMQKVLSLRIGGNDLMHALGVRRSPGRTLYEGPLERVISMLIGVFKPYGLSLSSPVYEVYSDLHTLAREIQQDLEYGLCGKTIIHPNQLETVLTGYRVPERDVLEARAIVDPKAPAVFAMNGRMCEPNTHIRWAKDILTRASKYGILREEKSQMDHFTLPI